MANRSSVLRGNEIILSITFLDACGNLANPVPLSSVKLSIYPPGHDPRLNDEEVNAWVRNITLLDGGSGTYANPSKVIQHQSVGKFTYSFTIPIDADLGPAFDRWQSTVDMEDLDETFTFVIVGGGSIGSTQLYNNNMVFVKLHKTIASIEGEALDNDFEWYFTTTYDPLYVSVRRIRLDLGSLITDVPDDTINLAIFEASLEANSLTFGILSSRSSEVLRFFEFARRQYVTCLTELILLNAVSGESRMDGGKSKRLGDLQTSYNGAGQINDLIDKALACRIKWEASLTSSGEIGPGTSQKPSMVIKGIHDIDRPNIGRTWEPTSTHCGIGSEYPAANTKTKASRLNRRWQKSFNTSRWNSRF